MAALDIKVPTQLSKYTVLTIFCQRTQKRLTREKGSSFINFTDGVLSCLTFDAGGSSTNVSGTTLVPREDGPGLYKNMGGGGGEFGSGEGCQYISRGRAEG